MRSVRPYQFFSLLDEPIADRAARVTIPHRRAAGTLTLLETFVLIAALKIVKANRVFEFGTFMGATTLNIARNLPQGSSVFAFDLDPAEAAIDQHPEDRELTEIHFAAPRLDFEGAPEAEMIQRVFGNSLTFDPARWAKSIDLVFIDGGHDRPTVKADTQSAFAMLRIDKPACIAWHDYGNKSYPELTAYLDGLSDLLHVEDTMIAVKFFNLPAGTQPLN
jgi:SAM-dependent methyltransferase